MPLYIVPAHFYLDQILIKVFDDLSRATVRQLPD